MAESKHRTDTLYRLAQILFYGSLLGLILAATLRAQNVPGTMHHQFSERDTSSWILCVENQTAANFTVTAAGINRALVSEVSVIGDSERSYRFTRRPRARWLRAFQIGLLALSLLQATPALEIGDGWQYVAPLAAGGIQIATPAIEANQRRDFELGTYWGAARTLAPGEAHCSLVMTAKVESENIDRARGSVVRLRNRPVHGSEAAGPAAIETRCQAPP
jgi:hypothetical protein